MAIANLSNGKTTLGFRLLNIETAQVTEVSLANLKDALQSGKLQIENLAIKDGIVIGSNGSIERLPKMVNKQLVGKSPLIILNRVWSEGYRVSDFKGTILNMSSKEALEYAKTNGISNGKIVGKQFIRSINGIYTIIEPEKNNELYKGTLDISTPPLPQIITNTSGCFNDHTLISYNSKLVCKYTNKSLRIELGAIKKGIMYEHKGYTLDRQILRELDINNEKDRLEINRLIRLADFRLCIDNVIAEFETRCAGKKDVKTGLIIPTTKSKYLEVWVSEDIIDSNNRYNDMTKKEIDLYIGYLELMKAKIYSQIMIESKKVALARKCSKDGISYSVLKNEEFNKEPISSINLEDIYKYHTEYCNVIVTGTQLKIVGLDGVYIYDMGLINETYHRSIVESSRNIKSIMFDSIYHDAVNELGELSRIKSGQSILDIPKYAKSIQAGSIIVLNCNTTIIFGDHIVECSTECFNTEQDVEADGKRAHENIKRVEVSCKDAEPNIIKALSKVGEIFDTESEIHLTFDIAPTDYVRLMYSNIKTKYITSKNSNAIDDGFILKIVKIAIETKLGQLSMIQKPIVMKMKANGDIYKTQSFDIFKDRLDTLIKEWKTKLEGKASSELRSKVNKIIKDIQNQVSYRERELEENKAKLHSKQQ